MAIKFVRINKEIWDNYTDSLKNLYKDSLVFIKDSEDSTTGQLWSDGAYFGTNNSIFTINEKYNDSFIETFESDFTTYNIIKDVNIDDIILWRGIDCEYKVSNLLTDTYIHLDVKNVLLIHNHLYKVKLLEHDSVQYQYLIHINETSNINEYQLPVATNDILGGVKIGTNVQIDESGKISVQDITSTLRFKNANNKTFLNINVNSDNNNYGLNFLGPDANINCYYNGKWQYSKNYDNYVLTSKGKDGLCWSKLESFSNYKTKQDPINSYKIGSGNTLNYVSNITLNENGEISITKDEINKASSENFGVVKTTSSVTDATGYMPCPIVNGVPYYEKLNLDTTSNYITIIDDTFIDNLIYKQPDGSYKPSTHSINFPVNKIIFYNGRGIKEFRTDGDKILSTLLPGNFYITKALDYKAYNYDDELKTVVWGECINLEYQTNGYDKLYEQNEQTTIDYTKDVIEIHHNSYTGNEMNFTVDLELEYPNYKLQGKNIKIFYFNDNAESNINLRIVPKNNSVIYTVKDPVTTYNIPYGGRFIMIDVYILQKCLMVEVTENINQNTNISITS